MMRRSLTALICAGSLAALGTTSAAASAAASAAPPAPAESTKILPEMENVSGAVDSAGGSLVAGVVAQLAPGDGLYAYHRDPAGHWSKKIGIPIGHQFAPEIESVAVAAGDDGFYLIAWTYKNDGGGGPDEDDVSTVYAATRLPSGRITGPTRLFASPNDTGLVLSTNAHGDAALTQGTPEMAARYVRGIGWTSFAVPGEPGEVPGAGAGPHKVQGVAMMSAARTVDITYEYRFDGIVHVIEQTRPDGATSFTRRDLYTAPDTSSAGYRIVMDSSGLQTIAIDDADDAIKIYRENTRRGPLEYRWRKPRGDVGRVAPLIASSGRFIRVVWTAEGASPGQTRLFNGTSWAPSYGTPDSGYGGMDIGDDGRGAAAGTPDGQYHVAWLERTSSIDADRESDGVIEGPYVRVGASSVSQTVSVERGPENTADRTVVHVRR